MSDPETLMENIVRQYGIATLKVRGNDHLDFHDCSVMMIKQMMIEAYEEGKKAKDK